MAKVEGSNPFIRLNQSPCNRGVRAFRRIDALPPSARG